jgi:hypothetical protein
MKRILPQVVPPTRPLFTWAKPCKHCPTAHGPGDPESDDYASIPCRDTRMEHTFACGWRPKGFCEANQRRQFYGIDSYLESDGRSADE